MRLGVIVLLLAIALAVASAPALGQASAVPSEEKKGEGPKNDKEAKKAAKEDKKAKKEDDEGGGGPGEEADDDDADDDKGEAGGDGGDGEEGEEGEGGGGEGDGATGRQPGGGGSGGDTGSGGGGSEGQDAQRSISSHGSLGGGGPIHSVSDLGCRQECDSPNRRAVGDSDIAALVASGGPGGLDREAISLAAVEDEGQFQEGRFALGPATAEDGNPGAFALLTLAAMVLLVGLVGGLRALHSGLAESQTAQRWLGR